MVGKASAAKFLAVATVNNFAAARGRFGWLRQFIFRYPFLRFSRPGGPGLLTFSRYNDSEFIDRPVGRA